MTFPFGVPHHVRVSHYQSGGSPQPVASHANRVTCHDDAPLAPHDYLAVHVHYIRKNRRRGGEGLFSSGFREHRACMPPNKVNLA